MMNSRSMAEHAASMPSVSHPATDSGLTVAIGVDPVAAAGELALREAATAAVSDDLGIPWDSDYDCATVAAWLEERADSFEDGVSSLGKLLEGLQGALDEAEENERAMRAWRRRHNELEDIVNAHRMVDRNGKHWVPNHLGGFTMAGEDGVSLSATQVRAMWGPMRVDKR